MDLVVDPNDTAQNTWYAGVYSGWGGPPNGLGGLYKTTNRGLAWTRLNNDDGVSSCAFNPLNANELYVTTETEGLLFSSNINSASPALTQVTSYPFRPAGARLLQPLQPLRSVGDQFWQWHPGGQHALIAGNAANNSAPRRRRRGSPCSRPRRGPFIPFWNQRTWPIGLCWEPIRRERTACSNSTTPPRPTPAVSTRARPSEQRDFPAEFSCLSREIPPISRIIESGCACQCFQLVSIWTSVRHRSRLELPR